MKAIKQSGLILFLIGLTLFTGTIFTGSFSLTSVEFDSFIKEKNYKNELIKEELQNAVVTTEPLNIFEFSSRVRKAYKVSNDHYEALIKKYDSEKNWTKKGEQYQYKIYGKPHSLSFELAKKAGSGFAAESPVLMWLLTFGLGIIGALLFIIPDVILY